MVEVFKTNVTEADHAQLVLGQLRKAFNSYTANFDLDDRDHILRVESVDVFVDASALMKLIADLGFHAEVLSDDVPVWTP